MDMATVKAEIYVSSKHSSPDWFLTHTFNKDLKIILERCDKRENRCTSDKGQKFVCQIYPCKKLFDAQRNLKEHVQMVHESVSVKCPKENCEKYLKPRSMTGHIRRIHENSNILETFSVHSFEKIFICTIKDCKMSHSSRLELIKHQKLEHSLGDTCKNCGKNFVALHRHQLRCLRNREKKFHCSTRDCNLSFLTKYELQRHTKFVHEHFKYTCGICGGKFSSIKTHQQSCTDNRERKHFCLVENCNWSFFTKSNLTEHHRAVHGDPIKCPRENCESLFKPNYLKRHIRYVHGGKEGLDECSHCGKRYACLRQHIVYCTSDGVKKIPCQVDNCNGKFPTILHMKQHVRATHSAPIKCPHKHCGKIVKRAALVQHLKIIHEATLETCSKCGKSIKYMEKHKKTCNKD